MIAASKSRQHIQLQLNTYGLMITVLIIGFSELYMILLFRHQIGNWTQRRSKSALEKLFAHIIAEVNVK